MKTKPCTAWDERDAKKLKTYRDTLTNEAEHLLAAARTETRALNETEQATFTEIRSELERIDPILAGLEEATRRRLEENDRQQLEIQRLLESAPRRTVHRADVGRPLETRAWLPSWSEYREGLETRAVPPQSEGTPGDGGYLVPLQYINEIFDRLRAMAVVLQAGPRVIVMEHMQAQLPIIGQSVTAAAIAENQDLPVSGMTFRALTLRARKIASLAVGSSEWFNDSSPSAREVLGYDMERTLALKIDELSLVGDGVGENPIGLFNGVGVPSTAATGALSLDLIAAAVAAVEARNATPSAIFMTPAQWSILAAQKDTGGLYVLNPSPAEAVPKRLFGVNVYVSPFVPVTKTMVLGMQHVAFGARQQIRLDYDRSGTYFAKDQVAVRCIARFDLGLLNVDAAQIVTGFTAPAVLEAREDSKNGPNAKK